MTRFEVSNVMHRTRAFRVALSIALFGLMALAVLGIALWRTPLERLGFWIALFIIALVVVAWRSLWFELSSFSLMFSVVALAVGVGWNLYTRSVTWSFIFLAYDFMAVLGLWLLWDRVGKVAAVEGPRRPKETRESGGVVSERSRGIRPRRLPRCDRRLRPIDQLEPREPGRVVQPEPRVLEDRCDRRGARVPGP
jgi:hypothetical protein